MIFTKKLFVIFALVILSNHLIAQKVLISKETAIDIALNYGLKTGLIEYKAELENDSIWLVSSLLCDDIPEEFYDTKCINAYTGKLANRIYLIMGVLHEGYGRIERTRISYSLNLDSLPTSDGLTRKLTDLQENEFNPVFSENDKKIAFQYGFRKIGIINSDGTEFKQICEECLYPQWLSDDWIMYFKDFEHIYKKNIISNVEIMITDHPYRYDDFQLSPNKEWIAYQSSEMWPDKDSLGNQILYASIDGQGLNLCLMSIDGKNKKYFKKDWTCYYNPCWTENSDSILFYISDQKYYGTNLDNSEINFYKYDKLQNISLNDFKKIINGSFPFVNQCQVYEIDSKSLTPIRLLLKDVRRYRDVNFSHNKKYLIYSQTDKLNGNYNLWIKKIE